MVDTKLWHRKIKCEPCEHHYDDSQTKYVKHCWDYYDTSECDNWDTDEIDTYIWKELINKRTNLPPITAPSEPPEPKEKEKYELVIHDESHSMIECPRCKKLSPAAVINPDNYHNMNGRIFKCKDCKVIWIDIDGVDINQFKTEW